MKNTCLLLLLLITTFSACQKGEKGHGICKDGFIIWGGEPAVDGLGWYFSETRNNGGVAYKFENLPARYQEDKLAVSICFYDTGNKYSCFCAVPLPLYHITSIRKRGLFN